jgi:beta-glucosidase
LDDPALNPYNKIAPSVVGSEKHKQLALEAARQSIVLLKNKNKTLPLNINKVKSIAVVGINAGTSEFGDYSGAPANAPVSILQGIRNRVGDKVKIVYAPWKSAVDELEIISKEYFPEGLATEYYANMQLKGDPKVRQEEWINYEPTNQAPDPFLPANPLSIRWSGKLKPTISGYYTFSFTSSDGCRLFIDGEKQIDSWRNRSISTDTVGIYLEAGKMYHLKAEYFDDRDYAIARLQWKIPTPAKKEKIDMYGEAGKAVRSCEKVIAVLGINKTIEREGKDRNDIHLPADQMEFLQEIHKINPNIVVVLVAGSSLAINWIDEHIPAIVNAWYPGEQGGRAVAEVLFGDYNPGGRLPITYYNSLDELPAFDDYDMTKGRTYQYFTGKPLYPFGYGLSYTTFEYKNLKLTDNEDTVQVSFEVKNTGSMTGDEVSQVYVKLPDTGVVMPIKELKGFQRNTIRKGETKKVEIAIRKDLLRYWDEKTGKFILPAGTFEFMVGSSSNVAYLRISVAYTSAPPL